MKLCKKLYSSVYTILHNLNFFSRTVTFDLYFPPNCEDIESFHEGLELSFRSLTENGPREWTPLMYYSSNSTQQDNNFNIGSSSIRIIDSTGDILTLRGYSVPYIIQTRGHYNASLCGGEEDVFQYPLQFRWLQTAFQFDNVIRDVIVLDNVSISLCYDDQCTTLLVDDFDSQDSIE